MTSDPSAAIETLCRFDGNALATDASVIVATAVSASETVTSKPASPSAACERVTWPSIVPSALTLLPSGNSIERTGPLASGIVAPVTVAAADALPAASTARTPNS